MRITFIGTCSGNEPMAGRHHCSFVIEHNLGVYWFDFGMWLKKDWLMAMEVISVWTR